MLRGAAIALVAVMSAACGASSVTPSPLLPHLGSFPAEPSAQLSAEVATDLQGVLDRAIGVIQVPGIAAAVIYAGQGVWAGTSGTADSESPLVADAQFGIGSVTKTVIAAQVLKLVEAGLVDLDKPISDYLGEDDHDTNGATVRQVLGMRSGVGDVAVGPEDICSDHLDASVTMADLRAMPLADPSFEPGTRFVYTNSNYVLAGILIEEVTGESLGTVLRDGVLAAPGLERLIYQDAEKPTAPLAAPFVVRPTGEEVPGPAELLVLGGGYLPVRCLASSAGPAGGMAADALTLARWGYLLYGGSILSADALADMADFKDDYGLAAHDHAARFGVAAIGHEGTVPGYTAQLLAFPDEGLAVAVLININGNYEGTLTTIAGQLRDALTE
jgi:CubicO group peptidase (beta-lactamase class C family)